MSEAGAGEQQAVMEVTLSFRLPEAGGGRLGEEICAVLYKEHLAIYPTAGETLAVAYREIDEIAHGNHRVKICAPRLGELEIYHLGYKYDDFLRTLFKLRNELAISDLLMHEKAAKPDFEAQYSYYDEQGEQRQQGACLVRIYETAAVIIPEDSLIVRMRFSELTRYERESHSLVIENEYGEKVILSMLGYQFDGLQLTLGKAVRNLDEKMLLWLKEIFPGVQDSSLAGAARLMKECKAVRRGELEAICPELWPLLESRLVELGIGEEYVFLKSLAGEERVAIGLKRGLMGDLTGEYLWFLIPIYNADPRLPGNAVALEAASSKGAGKATYFFRLTGRREYANPGRPEELHALADRVIRQINRAMLEINFRREPVYLPETRLQEPRYQKYLHSLRRLPALRELRDSFIGRVIHASPEQWQRNVGDLLRFNVGADDDSLKWSRGQALPGQDEEEDF